MDFTFEIPVTKELILSGYSEEQVMEYYLRVPVRKGLFRSPLRRDRHPTCSFFRNRRNVLVFKDFATGQCLDCFGIVQAMYGCGYHEALRIVANDLGLVHDKALRRNPGKINPSPVPMRDKEMTKIQVQVQDFTEAELRWWARYGITEDILDRFKVFSCRHVFLNDALFAESGPRCPIFGYYGGKYRGLEMWKIYFPRRRNYRFMGNFPARKLQGYGQLPKAGEFLVITKSMKDCMTLHSFGIPAVAPNSEHLFVPEATLEDLKARFKDVVVFYDNDRTGMYNMGKIRKSHPELLYALVPKGSGCKDISDFYKANGRERTEELISDFSSWVKSTRR